MNAPILNIWTQYNKHKSAMCKECAKKLKFNDTIVCVSRAQGKFTSVSNYHLECSEPFLKQTTKELSELLNKVLHVSQEFDAKRMLKQLM